MKMLEANYFWNDLSTVHLVEDPKYTDIDSSGVQQLLDVGISSLGIRQFGEISQSKRINLVPNYFSQTSHRLICLANSTLCIVRSNFRVGKLFEDGYWAQNI